ncbi:MAG: hypothetical protein WB781_16610, partial [Candidatus Sulfotelmatobacter sp.]
MPDEDPIRARESAPPPTLRELAMVLFRRRRVFVCVSGLVLAAAEAFYVPNGGVLRERSEPRKILDWGLGPGKYILFLGRFSPEKGCHLLVEAFEQIETDVKL